MTFYNKIYNMKSIAYALTHEVGPWNQWVSLGLMCIADKAMLFDACIHASPFYLDFNDRISENAKMQYPDHEVLAFFEDIVILIREKNLYLGACFTNTFEEEILSYFEHCGQWSELDGTLVSEWYWHHLPLRSLKCLAKQRRFISDCHFEVFSEIAQEPEPWRHHILPFEVVYYKSVPMNF